VDECKSLPAAEFHGGRRERTVGDAAADLPGHGKLQAVELEVLRAVVLDAGADTRTLFSST